MEKDGARTWTDKELEEMEKEIASIYKKSAKGIIKKWTDFMNDTSDKVSELQDEYGNALVSGDDKLINEVKKKLADEVTKQTIGNSYYKEMVDEVTTQLANVNKTALAYVNKQMPSVYTKNFNFIDKDTTDLITDAGIKFNIVDEAVVKRRVTDGDIKLPKKKVDVPKDKKWNTKQLNSSVLQGILQGESMDKIAKRIMPVVGNNRESAIRNARTMVTQAENQGRLDRYKDLVNKGVVMKKIWMATGDDRTRAWHLDMDGQEKEIEEPFIDGLGNKLEMPGDPTAPGLTVYNCRCTTKSKIIGFRKKDGTISYVDYDYSQDAPSLHDQEIASERNSRMTRQKVQKSSPTSSLQNVVNGKDLSDTWTRRPDQFDFAIEDVINAQGFDGLPKVVNAEEFDKAVQKNNFIAQRTYSAPDQETLDMYRDQLYHGEWYVDCSNGGCVYGKGMYSVYANNTEVTEYIEQEMRRYSARRGIDYNYIETFTLTPDARTVTPNEIIELRQSYNKKLMAEFKERGGWKSSDAMAWAEEHDISGLDDGSFAALMGYDAILTHGIDDYAIVLNRTKLIIKEPEK
ncbi:MAG TPA: hypothetical protein DHV37_05730 [Erysipelotrichaceae bacterium]|nr:hypothetical protein [Erysipelotrichaceae bacterium]